ncbi:putative amidase [Bordetella avium 197N]|uniref:Amidase n=2 Tax=Bordetella avium TaxID=521 RepID=Q2L313_BORA1|nr:putative amidase [Bordetella avium 197N]
MSSNGNPLRARTQMLHQLSFEKIRALYASGEVSPVEVTYSALRHAENVNLSINALAMLDHDRALRAAAQSQTRWRLGRPLGPLDGMPVTVKDFAAVKGWPTRRGSAVSSGEPQATSTVFVQRLLNAGMIPLGKTRAPEFNWKTVTDSPAYGITRNPWNIQLTPGGSSGGCAAAVSAGVVRVSMGSDAGGSVRIPSSFTGLIGFKPSFGRIPASPLPSAFSQVVHTGPIGASMREIAEVMRVAAGPSGKDWTSFTGSIKDDVQALSDDAKRLTIGVLDASRWSASSCEEVRRGMSDTIALIESSGFNVETVDFDVAAATATALIFYRVGCETSLRGVPQAEQSKVDPGLFDFVKPVEGLKLFDFLEACRLRDLYANALAELFDRVDVLMLPTMPILPFEAGRLSPEGWHSNDPMSWNPFTPAFNIAQVPAMSYPVWPEGSTLPVGIQFVAPRYCDDRLMTLGAWLEQQIPIRLSPLAYTL